MSKSPLDMFWRQVKRAWEVSIPYCPQPAGGISPGTGPMVEIELEIWAGNLEPGQI